MLSSPEIWKEFFETYYRDELNKLAEKTISLDGESSITVDFLKDLIIFKEGKIAENLLEEPDIVLRHANEGILRSENIHDVKLERCYARFYNLPISRRVLIRDLRSEHISKFVSIEGIVRKVTEVRPRIVEAAFMCSSCGKKLYVEQEDNTLKYPYECRNCNSRRFILIPEESKSIDSQRIKIQEYPENLRGGEQPQTLDVILESDLTGVINPGDRVVLNGIVRASPRVVGGKKLRHMDIVLEGNSIEVLQQEYEEFEITEEDKKKILELSNDPEIYSNIVKSIAPAIYGHEDVKLAVALQLFGGVPKKLPDGTEIRGDAHVLLVGDPGVAKSQLLRYVHRIAPRSVYTTGKGTTSAGLTASATRDEYDGRWTLEAGALVLADKGVALVDEIDKMRCVTGDTLVQMADGRILPIKEIAIEYMKNGEIEELGNGRTIRPNGKTLKVLTMNENYRIEPREVKAVHEYSMPLKIYEVRLQSGESIKTTVNHPFIVFKEGRILKKPAKELKNGDWICVPRKRLVSNYNNLEKVLSKLDGHRTIIDVIPECGNYLSQLRKQLRLFQSECGLNQVTYLDFEKGKANLSIEKAQSILQKFEERIIQAKKDLKKLAEDDLSWEDLEQIKNRYHISQKELADRISYQQQISAKWGKEIKKELIDAMRDIATQVADVDLKPLRNLVKGDIKCRRVSEVRELSYSSSDGKVNILRHKIADLLHVSEKGALNRAKELLEDEPDASNLETLKSELAKHNIPLQRVAEKLGVSSATVSRWFNNKVRVNNTDEIKKAAIQLINEKRRLIREILMEIEYRLESKVYDLTVDGTHNFIANGMIVHNSEDRGALHEAMEQQTVSIAKAGINAVLRARCALLGAANPKYGRFDRFAAIAEQIDLSPTLLSRFDLIFVMTDDPDEVRDRELAQHILDSHELGEKLEKLRNIVSTEYNRENIEMEAKKIEPAIDPELLRKYIAYAKRTVFPVLTEEAKEKIIEFYLSLRTKVKENSPVPVTARQLEALIRLAEASARLRLRDKISLDDIQRVIRITRTSLEQIAIDPETGEIDIDYAFTGTSKTQRDRIMVIKKIVEDLAELHEKGAPEEEILNSAEEHGISRDKAKEIIYKMREKGELYCPRHGHFMITHNY